MGALDGIKIRPYDLEVVMVGQIADSDLEFPPLPFVLEKTECFTMSPKGVVHLEPGHPSEFIILTFSPPVIFAGNQGVSPHRPTRVVIISYHRPPEFVLPPHPHTPERFCSNPNLYQIYASDALRARAS